MINSDIILKEGYKPILILVLLTLFINIVVSDFLGGILVLITLITIYAYRNPRKHIFENSHSVLSPIDGKVMAIDKLDKEIKIYCKISILNNHAIRAPFSGAVETSNFQNGLNLSPNTPKANILNEQVSLKFTSDDKNDTLELKLIGGFFNLKLESIQIDEVSQGEKITTFLDGLAVITVINDDLLINIGDKLTSGQTIIFKK